MLESPPAADTCWRSLLLLRLGSRMPRMNRLQAFLLMSFVILGSTCWAEKALHVRKAYCVAAIPTDWAGGVNRASHPEEGMVSIAALRDFDVAAFPTLKKDLAASYEPSKVLDDSANRLWFEYKSAATPASFDRHWLVVVTGKEETCTLSIHFASQAEDKVRPIAESLKAMR